ACRISLLTCKLLAVACCRDVNTEKAMVMHPSPERRTIPMALTTRPVDTAAMISDMGILPLHGFSRRNARKRSAPPQRLRAFLLHRRPYVPLVGRSEERRVGKDGRSRLLPYI